MNWVNKTMGITVFALFLTGGYFFLQWRLDETMHRRQLRTMSRRYEKLEEKYSAAVRRTAVTDLLVKDGTLSVRIRTVEGTVKTIRTPFDPGKEIYVDFVIVDGRCWIRRVFDANTTPENALVVDPRFTRIDWSKAGARYGKAVYRQLAEGRWVVSVTGNGALGLRKVPEDGGDLSSAPQMAEFEDPPGRAR